MSLWARVKMNSELMTPVLNILYCTDGSPINLAVREIFASNIENAVCGLFTPNERPSLLGFNPEIIDHHERIREFVKQLTRDMGLRINSNNDSSQSFLINCQLRPACEKIVQWEPIKFFQKLRECIKFEIDTLFPCTLAHYQLEEFKSKISEWQWQQKLWAVGFHPPSPIQLADLKENAEVLYNQLVNNLQTVRNSLNLQNLGQPRKSVLLSEFKNLSTMIIELMRATFLVTEQPQFVVMKKAQPKFEAIFLLAETVTETAVANLFIINESQAKRLYDEGTLSPICYRKKGTEEILKIFKIGSNKATLNSLNNTITFNKPFIKENIRDVELADTPTRTGVMEDKLCFAVQMTIKINLLDEPVEMWTMSFPFTFASHESQIASGMGTIFWGACINSEARNRKPFDFSQEIDWNDFIFCLSAFFNKNFGIRLTEKQMECLHQKAFNSCTGEKKVLPWTEFINKKFFTPPDNAAEDKRKWFSFSEWLFSSFLLLKSSEHNGQLQKLWKLGYIKGFIDKIDAERTLKGKPVGTFLLRFSDSLRGAISIACVLKYETHDSPQICNLKPYTKKELTNSLKPSLADIIKNIVPQLTYLESFSQPKDELFAPFYTPQNKSSFKDPYVGIEEKSEIQLPKPNAPIAPNYDVSNNSSPIAPSPETPPTCSSFSQGDQSSSSTSNYENSQELMDLENSILSDLSSFHNNNYQNDIVSSIYNNYFQCDQTSPAEEISSGNSNWPNFHLISQQNDFENVFM